jgi:hypothetical protein
VAEHSNREGSVGPSGDSPTEEHREFAEQQHVFAVHEADCPGKVNLPFVQGFSQCAVGLDTQF